MGNTEKNLKDAFAGESQANRKYLAFAKKAEEEGYISIAKLFKAAAEAETIHAHNHLKELGGIKSTRENLLEAINGETFEFQNMYPKMIEEAKAENMSGAMRSFNYANEVEKVHAQLFKKALENIDKKENIDYYVCPVCGNTFENEVPDKCPICNALKKFFIKIE
ncbi:MAG: rubrerythrin family protein [Proteobacteria bacterium]|nr:rubrerythrin family protein [Pseudomonadota bacterium]